MTTPAIPVSSLVTVNPAVEVPGGSNLTLIGLLLTQTTVAASGGAPRAPAGTVLSFASQLAVGAYFGTASTEYALAGNYFAGYDNSQKKPATFLIANFNYSSASPAYVRGVSYGTAAFMSSPVSSGTLNITIDGTLFATTGINISSGGGGTSFSAVAGLVQTALQTEVASVSVGSATGAIAGTTFTAASALTGSFAVGQILSGSGVTANTTIVGLGSGTGGLGTYIISPTQTAASTTITGKVAPPLVLFDSVSASFYIVSGNNQGNSTITATTGTVGAFLQTNVAQSPTLSQGAVMSNGSGIPAAMNAILAMNNNWGGFTSTFEPTTADKLIFAAWVSPLPYWWAMWDTITQAAACATPDTTSAGAQINAAAYNGVHCLTYDPVFTGATTAQLQATAAAALGVGASVNYAAFNGRITWAYRSQAGLLPTVTNGTIAANIEANKNSSGFAPIYNFYGGYANAGNAFVFFQFGSISGQWNWLDSYTNQIWLNNNIQTALVQLLQSIGNVPYNPAGFTLIRQCLYSGGTPGTGSQPQSGQALGPIAAALNFGAIRAGVILSAQQILDVNNAAGFPIDGFLNQYGWYLQVLAPAPSVRAARQTPIVNFWYMDGQSVQFITVASVDVQ